MTRLDRKQLKMHPLSERNHKLDIKQIAVWPDDEAPALSEKEESLVAQTADRMRTARDAGKPIMLTFGAHFIKNGLAPVVIRMIEEGWITHVATNGAGSIHDWEFAYLGKSTEDVRANTAKGRFGTWEETGRNINLAVAVGGTDDLGYGWSVAKMIAEDGLEIPPASHLSVELSDAACDRKPDEDIGAIADLLYLVNNFDIPRGWMKIEHPFKQYSVQHAAYQAGIPMTVHPGIGYDIIYTHPMNCGGAIGRGSVRDFLEYADSVSRLDGGVHLTIGSAVMAPMIFEKALSMANNLAIEQGRNPSEEHYMAVIDIQDGGDWNWREGEPPMDNPAYYLRFCKSFYRMGGVLDYICMDNRSFMLNLYRRIRTM